MDLKVDTSLGWTQAIIDGDCEFNRFYKIAEDMAQYLDIEFTDKLKDFDSAYWDFEYEGSKLSLHPQPRVLYLHAPQISQRSSHDRSLHPARYGRHLVRTAEVQQLAAC